MTTISRPIAGPTTHARMRRAGAGRISARAITITPSSGSLTNARGVKWPGWSGATSAAHTSRNASSVSTHGDGHADASVSGIPSGIPLRHRCPLEAGSRPVAPQPPDVAAERLGEQGERGGEADAGEGEREHARCRDHKRDALRRRNRLSPVAPAAAARASTRPATRRPGTRSGPRRSGAPTRRPRGRRRRRARGSGTRRPRRPSARPGSTPSRCAARRIRRRSRAPARRPRAPPAGAACAELPNESAASAATPTASVARTSVTHPAGPIRSERLRSRL